MLRKGQFSHRQAGDEGNWTDDANQWFGQPDVLCLHEYLHIYQGRSTETPERRLVAAVLRDAVECYLRTCRAPNRRKKRSFRELKSVFSETMTAVFSASRMSARSSICRRVTSGGCCWSTKRKTSAPSRAGRNRRTCCRARNCFWPPEERRTCSIVRFSWARTPPTACSHAVCDGKRQPLPSGSFFDYAGSS
jgi:hypothetical protein